MQRGVDEFIFNSKVAEGRLKKALKQAQMSKMSRQAQGATYEFLAELADEQTKNPIYGEFGKTQRMAELLDAHNLKMDFNKLMAAKRGGTLTEGKVIPDFIDNGSPLKKSGLPVMAPHEYNGYKILENNKIKDIYDLQEWAERTRFEQVDDPKLRDPRLYGQTNISALKSDSGVYMNPATGHINIGGNPAEKGADHFTGLLHHEMRHLQDNPLKTGVMNREIDRPITGDRLERLKEEVGHYLGTPHGKKSEIRPVMEGMMADTGSAILSPLNIVKAEPEMFAGISQYPEQLRNLSSVDHFNKKLVDMDLYDSIRSALKHDILAKSGKKLFQAAPVVTAGGLAALAGKGMIKGASAAANVGLEGLDADDLNEGEAVEMKYQNMHDVDRRMQEFMLKEAINRSLEEKTGDRLKVKINPDGPAIY